MKNKTFKSFLYDYAKDMNPELSLSLFKNEKYALNNSRLLNVYLFYVFFNMNVSKTLLEKKDKLPNLYNTYLKYKNKYNNFSLSNLDEKVKDLDEFDELRQLYTSYLNLHVNKSRLLKRVYYKKIVDLKRKKAISNYRIYNDLNLNHGNTNDYIKNQNLNKLSFQNIKRIHDYLSSK